MLERILNRMSLAPDVGGGSPPQPNSSTPALGDVPGKFRIGDKVYTTAEAETELRGSATLREQLAEVNRKLETHNKFFTVVQNALTRGDVNAYRMMGKAVGIADNKIEESIKRSTAGAGNNGNGHVSRYGLNDDDDEDDLEDDNEDVGRSRSKSGAPRELSGLIASLNEKLDQVVATQAEHATWMQGMGRSSESQFTRQLTADINGALDDDEMLGKHWKGQRAKVSQHIRKAALEAAKADAKTRGVSDQTTVQAAIAKARSLAEDFGWFDPDAAPAVPSAGLENVFGPDVRTAYKPAKDPARALKELDVGGRDFETNLGSILAGAID